MKEFFKKKMSAMRFCADTPTSVTPTELIEGLQTHVFVNGIGVADNAGFVDFEHPYGGEYQFREHDHVYQNHFVGLIRFDKRRVPSSALKIRVVEAVKKEKERTGKPSISRTRKKEITEQVKCELLGKAIPSTTFIPFVVDMSNGNGYFYSTSNSDFEDFSDLFSRAYGYTIQRVAEDAYPEDFLTHIWWETESNSFLTTEVRKEEVKTWVGDKVSTVGEDQKLTISGENIEEAKLSISDGAYVSRMEILVSSSYGDRKFNVNLEGVISGMQFAPEELPDDDSEDLTLFISMTSFYFEVMDAWKAQYEEAEQSGKGLTPEIRKNWGKGNYCSKAFEDV